MRKMLTLCLAFIGFGLGMQDMSAQTEATKTEKTAVSKAEALAKKLNLDGETKKQFLQILEKRSQYLERKKDSENIEKVEAKISEHTDRQMKALLTEDQYNLFKKAKLD